MKDKISKNELEAYGSSVNQWYHQFKKCIEKRVLGALL